MPQQDIFISYRKKSGSDIARRLAERLHTMHGMAVFLDEETLPGGADWRASIDSTLASVRAVIVVVSQGLFDEAKQEDVLLEELRLATARHQRGQLKGLFTVTCEGVNIANELARIPDEAVADHLRRIQCSPMYSGSNNEIARIARAIAATMGVPPNFIKERKRTLQAMLEEAYSDGRLTPDEDKKILDFISEHALPSEELYAFVESEKQKRQGSYIANVRENLRSATELAKHLSEQLSEETCNAIRHKLGIKRRAGTLAAAHVNSALRELGLQVKDSAGVWSLTEQGRTLGQEVPLPRRDGTVLQSLRWQPAVQEQVKARLLDGVQEIPAQPTTSPPDDTKGINDDTLDMASVGRLSAARALKDDDVIAYIAELTPKGKVWVRNRLSENDPKTHVKTIFSDYWDYDWIGQVFTVKAAKNLGMIPWIAAELDLDEEQIEARLDGVAQNKLIANALADLVA